MYRTCVLKTTKWELKKKNQKETKINGEAYCTQGMNDSML